MTSKVGLIIRREYLQSVSKKSFIITTLLVPVLMLLLSVLPVVIMVFSGSDTKTVAVVDDSGIIFENLADTETVKFVKAESAGDSVATGADVYGVLLVDKDIVERPSGVSLLTNEAALMAVESEICHQMENIIEDEKLKKLNITNLQEILAQVETTVTLRTTRADSAGDESVSQSAGASYGIGLFMMFLLYMFLLMYGAAVMNSIIEEKNNRVLEVMVSSVKPSELLVGKIVGVGLVAVTQIFIWGIIVALIMTLVMPAVIPGDVLSQASAFNAGTLDSGAQTVDVEMLGMVGLLTNVGYMLKLFGYMLLFLVGGFLFYAAIFAAIGSSVDNVQDSAQLQMIPSIPIIAGLMIGLAVMADPESTFAMVMSLIPFTAPMVTIARIPFGIPDWQIWASAAVIIVSIAGIIWLSGKIYRIGIFMHGKKPTLKELAHWIRYK